VKYPPQVTPLPTPEPKYQNYAEAINMGDFQAALDLIDENAAGNADYYRDNPDSLYSYQYNRGYILEMLDRPDEALTEYIAIYEAAPESGWGMLAALHLERIDS
jgi:tetratricopeptide (TPR) repeat protein